MARYCFRTDEYRVKRPTTTRTINDNIAIVNDIGLTETNEIISDAGNFFLGTVKTN